MPDKKFMTLEEFLQAKADSTRNAAFEKSKNRKTGIKIPYKPSKEYLEGLLSNITGAKREIADTNFVGPSIESVERVKNGSGNINYYRKRYYNSLQEYNDKCDYGYNCIGTATDNYPEDSRTITNEDFYKNYNKYGFVRIPFSEVKQGDIVQDKNHALIYSGQDEFGSPLFNYSRGGVTEYDYVKDGHYPSKNYVVSRYVGTPELIKQWTEEYNQKRLGGMRKVRKKKFIGGILSAVGSIASAAIQSAQQRKQLEEQQAAQRLAQNQTNANAYISNMNTIANQDTSSFYDKFKPSFRCGGKKRMKANLGKYKPRFDK